MRTLAQTVNYTCDRAGRLTRVDFAGGQASQYRHSEHPLK